MHTGKGRIVETILEDGRHLVRISCPPNLVPAAGQYLLAGGASDSPLPVSLFHTESTPDGCIAAMSEPVGWKPGQEIAVRGPLGRGFELHPAARKMALAAFDGPPMLLRGLIQPSLDQGAAVVVVSDSASDRLPDEVEVQPFSGLAEVLAWADFAAFDTSRENLHELRERLGSLWQLPAVRAAQVLVRTPMPCGGIADCGVCAVSLRSGGRLACKDGPVFDWRVLA